jgi:hypothetical protein
MRVSHVEQDVVEVLKRLEMRVDIVVIKECCSSQKRINQITTIMNHLLSKERAPLVQFSVFETLTSFSKVFLSAQARKKKSRVLAYIIGDLDKLKKCQQKILQCVMRSICFMIRPICTGTFCKTFTHQKLMFSRHIVSAREAGLDQQSSFLSDHLWYIPICLHANAREIREFVEFFRVVEKLPHGHGGFINVKKMSCHLLRSCAL